MIKTNFANFEMSDWEHASPTAKSSPNKNAFEYLNTNITNLIENSLKPTFLDIATVLLVGNT